MNSYLFDFKLKATRIATLLTIIVILIGLFTHIFITSTNLHILLIADIATLSLLIYSYFRFINDNSLLDRLLFINYLVLSFLIFFVYIYAFNPYVIIWYPPLVMSAMIIGGYRLGVVVTLSSLIFLNIATYNEVSIHSLISLNLSVLGAATFGAIITNQLQKYAQQNYELQVKLLHMANHDFLTKLPNRRFFMQECKKLIALASRKKEPLALLYLDLDHFKKINDTFGHQRGDDVLVHFAQILQQYTREYDLKARIGGEEFAVCIYGEPIENVLTIAHKIRKQFEATSILPQKTTVSIGLVYTPTPQSIQHLLQIADQALYEAKEGGRNQVVYKIY